MAVEKTSFSSVITVKASVRRRFPYNRKTGVATSLRHETRDAARELENRLLIAGTQFHTESGVHAKLLETWEHWAQRVGFETASISIAEAKENLEERLSKLNSEFHATAKLPWQ